MDPTSNLLEQRKLAESILKTWDDCNGDGSFKPEQAESIAKRAFLLAELVEALDEWIHKGGFLPQPWQNQGRD